MKSSIKRWIANKIGAILMADLPGDIAQDLYNYWWNKTLDKILLDRLDNAAKTHYTTTGHVSDPDGPGKWCCRVPYAPMSGRNSVRDCGCTCHHRV